MRKVTSIAKANTDDMLIVTHILLTTYCKLQILITEFLTLFSSVVYRMLTQA